VVNCYFEVVVGWRLIDLNRDACGCEQLPILSEIRSRELKKKKRKERWRLLFPESQISTLPGPIDQNKQKKRHRIRSVEDRHIRLLQVKEKKKSSPALPCMPERRGSLCLGVCSRDRRIARPARARRATRSANWAGPSRAPLDRFTLPVSSASVCSPYDGDCLSPSAPSDRGLFRRCPL
jgi:hypothetical protein